MGATGGGIACEGSNLTLTRCAIVNSASGSASGVAFDGGGVYLASGVGTFTDCTFSGNTSGLAGGAVELASSSGSFTNCAFSGNTSLNVGGAIALGSSSASFTNCTISGNTATGLGAGGGISFINAVGDKMLAVTNSTIVNNTGADTGGIRIEAGTGITATLTLRNSIIANNTGPSLKKVAGVGSTATITSLSYNLTSDNGGGFLNPAADQLNTNPLLDALKDNGGPTQTHALLPGSPAIDEGASSGSSTDQRGFPRPLDDPAIPNALGGDGADSGAFELSLPPPTPTATQTATPTRTRTPTTGIGNPTPTSTTTVSRSIRTATVRWTSLSSS